MRRTFLWAGIPISLVALLACGGSCPEPAAPTTEQNTVTPPSDDETPLDEVSGGEDEASTNENEPGPGDDEAKSAEEVAPEPKFPENATVAEAIAAVPRGATRANMEQDVLGEPLQNAALYEPCKVGSQSFKVKVAVWGGRAVGVDVETPNKKLADCVATQVRGVEWRDKVRSLNTVEFSM